MDAARPSFRHAPVEPVEPAVEALAAGRIVLVNDPVRSDRGGVLAVRADLASVEQVNFLALHGRGLVGAAMPPERLEQLDLPLQGAFTEQLERENYVVSVEAAEGTTTGISAADRARTLHVLAHPEAGPDDLVTPGHMFPAMAARRGVIARPGWAEAAIDLARLADVPPVVAFCHVLDDAGEPASGEELVALAEARDLPQVSVAAISAHRMATERFVTEATASDLPTRWGDFHVRVFVDELGRKQHLALTLGEVDADQPTLVRVHSECLTGDLFGSLRCDCGAQLAAAMERIRERGHGVLLYLRQEGRGIGLVNKVNAYALQDSGRDTVEANEELGFEPDLRDFGVGAQMLLALGVERVRLLTNNPRKVRDLTGYGINVVDREPVEVEPGPYNETYLRAKKDKLGHLLEEV